MLDVCEEGDGTQRGQVKRMRRQGWGQEGLMRKAMAILAFRLLEEMGAGEAAFLCPASCPNLLTACFLPLVSQV